MSSFTSPPILQPGEVAGWIAQPGRRVVWFHSPCDGPGVMVMQGWRALPAELRERVPLRLLIIDDIPSGTWHEFGTRWGLRHMSELTVWEERQMLWQGVPFAGLGRDWKAWLEKWGLG